jgi:hypothetical protein
VSSRSAPESKAIGFPTGRGPMLTETAVVWEMADERGVTQLWEQALPDYPSAVA